MDDSEAIRATDSRPEINLRPLMSEDTAELLRIHREPEVVAWWGEPEPAFPWDEPDATRLTIEVDTAVAGLVQYQEENEPRYRHASIDIFLDPALHGRGIGTEVVRRIANHLFEERGHHRITIDPALANAPAVRAYAKAGFATVGVMEGYECHEGRWRDGLLMELVRLR